MFGSEFKALREANNERQAVWDKDRKIKLSYRGSELAGEVGELCNVLKKLEREQLGIKGSRATVEDAKKELADVIICVDLIAKELNIEDVFGAVAEKFNADSKKHGFEVFIDYIPDHKQREDFQEAVLFFATVFMTENCPEELKEEMQRELDNLAAIIAEKKKKLSVD